MNRLINGHRNGFTIIELMIVLIIIAILVALAYPAYTDYIRKAKRGEAQQLLLNWAINQEIHRSNNPTYDDGTAIGVPTDLPEYTFSVGNVSGTTYTLTAAPKGDQLNDVARDGLPCNPLSLNELQAKLPPSCWE